MGVGVQLDVAPGDRGLLEFTRSRLTLVLLATLLLAAAVAWLLVRAPGEDPPEGGIPGDVYEIQVEVLNGTEVRGLAGTQTRLLRRAGFDVVHYGNYSSQTEQVARILLRNDSVSGDPAVAALMRELGLDTVYLELDPARLLDVSIVLGLDRTPLEVDP